MKKCDKLQRFAPVSHLPTQQLIAIWGINTIGTLPLARGKLKYVIVAVDYFTKYVEAEALATITTDKIIRFVYHTIFYRYVVPTKIVSNNRMQFDNAKSRNFALITRFKKVTADQWAS